MNIESSPTVGFAGDWHGNTPWARHCIRSFAKRGVSWIYQLGDFGVWHGDNGQEYRDAINDLLSEKDQMLIVVPGNHENYNLLEAWPKTDDGFIYEPKNDRILYTPRGHVWTHNGVRFAALGGAFSIDKGMRREGVSWWPQEEIVYSDIVNLVNNMTDNGWETVDVLLTHDIPAGCAVGQKTFQLPVDLENESYRQRMVLRTGVDACAPHFVLHGHWHKLLMNDIDGISFTKLDVLERQFDYRAEVIGLAADGDQHNVALAEIDPLVGLSNVRIGGGVLQ